MTKYNQELTYINKHIALPPDMDVPRFTTYLLHVCDLIFF